jgi:hypothetical protein
MSVTREKLSKFIKQTEIIISSVEEDNSETSKIFKLTLAQPVRAEGSNVTPDGQKMVIPDAKEVFVHESDHDAFMADCEEGEGDTLVYRGSLKLDVSKPNGRTVNGAFVVTKPAKAWLTSVAFSKRGGTLRTDRQNNLNQAIKQIFGGAADNIAGTPIVSAASLTAPKKNLEPVDAAKK